MTLQKRRQRSARGSGESLREEILVAAEELLIETGDEDAVSIRAVADRVGVTPPSIYMHFADKTQLVLAVCDRQFESFDAAMEGAASAATDTLHELWLRGRAYIEYGVAHPESYRIMFMSRKLCDVPDNSERVMNNLSFAHLSEAVVRAQQEGTIIQGDVMMQCIGLWTAVHGVTSLLIAHPQFPWPDVDEVINHALDMGVAGLRQPAAAPR